MTLPDPVPSPSPRTNRRPSRFTFITLPNKPVNLISAAHHRTEQPPPHDPSTQYIPHAIYHTLTRFTRHPCTDRHNGHRRLRTFNPNNPRHLKRINSFLFIRLVSDLRPTEPLRDIHRLPPPFPIFRRHLAWSQEERDHLSVPSGCGLGRVGLDAGRHSAGHVGRTP